MYKYDIDRLWLGDMPRVEGSFKGDGETRISLYPGEYLSLRYNGAEIARVGNVSERGSYDVPSGTTIPKGNYTIGEEIPREHTRSTSVVQPLLVCVSFRMLRKPAIPSTRVKRRSLTGTPLKEPLHLAMVTSSGWNTHQLS